MSKPQPNMPSSEQRVEALFQAAVQLVGTERAAFLNGACLGDPALRQRLDALLAAYDETGVLLAPLAAPARATVKVELPDAGDELVGTRISHYKILQRLGEGGCGAVYL